MKQNFTISLFLILGMIPTMILGQSLPIPNITYSISDTRIDCENNKVCYTVGVESDQNGTYYFDGATFRYYVDPLIYQTPVVADHDPIPQFLGVADIYLFTLQATESPVIGRELGYDSDNTTWVKGTLSAQSPGGFGRVQLSTTPFDLVEICLTAKDPLDEVEPDLCYPFIFDANHINPDNGIINGTEGLQTSYTENATTTTPGTIYAGLDNAKQYIYQINNNWDGVTTANQPFGTIGQPSSVGCLINECQLALPVELISFTAEAQSGSAILAWTTATEINNDYFEVQRSADGRAWETIGMVNGAGTTTLTQEYNYTDGAPYLGVNYYRLEQFDLNGSSEFSEVRKVIFEDGQDVLSVKMFPNPTAGQLRISSNQQLDNHRMVISDITGKIFMNNDFVNGSEIDLQNFNPGMYLVRIFNQRGDVVTTQRVIKSAN